MVQGTRTHASTHAHTYKNVLKLDLQANILIFHQPPSKNLYSSSKGEGSLKGVFVVSKKRREKGRLVYGSEL